MAHEADPGVQLEEHPGPYEAWPQSTRLLRDGVDTGARVHGYALLHQFAVPGGRFLLITDYQCPWEEETEVLLLDENLSLLSRMHFGLPWGFFSVVGATVVDQHTLDMTFSGRASWRVTMIGKRRWLFGSLLQARCLGREVCR